MIGGTGQPMNLQRVALASVMLVFLGLLNFTNAQENPNFDEVSIRVLPVRDNIYMLVGLGGNITVQVGENGVLVVDTQFAPLSEKIKATINDLAQSTSRYIIINTHVHLDHVGGNEALAQWARERTGTTTRIIAHENVLVRMTATPDENVPETQISPTAWPNAPYLTGFKDLYFNGEPIEILHQPEAHTDGDSMVFFRSSDVVSTGDIFTPGNYPVIDIARGGSVQGIINALNRLLRITVVEAFQEGGTKVIPGHGRLCEEADVVEYRNMITIIRDRVQNLINRGMSLQEVKNTRPTLDYDTEYGSDTGFWTTDMFIEAVYRSLSE